MTRRKFIAGLGITVAPAAALAQVIRTYGVDSYSKLGLARNGVFQPVPRTATYLGPAIDDFESYTAEADLGGLNGGLGWSAAYVSRSVLYITKDDFESYTVNADLGGLNGGFNWSAAYVSRSVFFLVTDNFESYTASANLDGLNGGTNWAAAYVSRP